MKVILSDAQTLLLGGRVMRGDNLSSGIIGITLIVSILVAWAAILVPSHAATSLHSVGMDGAYSASNAARKSNRLAEARGQIKIIELERKSARKIPAGCETAFGSRAKSEKDAVRCIT